MVKILDPHKPALNIIICTEEYYQSWDHLEPQKGLGEMIFIGVIFVTYIVMLVPLYKKRKENERKDAEASHRTRKAVPKSLESLLVNLGMVGLGLFIQSLFIIMNRQV